MAFARSVRVYTIRGAVEQIIYGLDSEETYQVVSQARMDGWYDNDKLIDFVLECGIKNGEVTSQIINGDVFLKANLAREIWLETLRRFRREIQGLTRSNQLDLQVPRIRHYRFGGLATPGILGILLQKLQFIDPDKFLEAFFEATVVDSEVGGKRLSETERREHFFSKIDDRLPWLLTTLGFDNHTFDRRPLNLLRHPGERLWVALQLAYTLDWQQYAMLLEVFNIALDELLYRSRRLGGGQLERRESRLPTGVPPFFQLVKPLDHLPLQVCLAALDDLRTGQWHALSPQDRRLLRQTFNSVMLEYAPRFSAISGDEELAEVCTSSILELARRLSEHKKAVQRFCHVYQEAFAEYLREKQFQIVENIVETLRSSVIPDGILLVEGDSDQIYFSALLRLLNMHNLLIKIEYCGGKNGVVTKYGEFTKRLPFLGSIIAVVDGDAETEYKELRHRSRFRKYDRVYRLSRKEIEDVFPKDGHTRTLKQCYFGDEPFEIESGAGENSIVVTLKKLLWDRKRQEFNKVVYAKLVIGILQTVQEFPEELVEIGDACLEQAKRRASDVPFNRSVLSLDQMSRSFWQHTQASG